MNENIDLTKILKGCHKGFKLYSSIFGDVYFQRINLSRIEVVTTHDIVVIYRSNGEYLTEYVNAECTLFPSKDQRDWSKFTASWYKKEKFDPNTLKPFDKVLVHDTDGKWRCNLFSHIRDNSIFPYAAIDVNCSHCIPYNEDTKHLLGTIEEAPEYYRYW